jgi:NitT/TauT family transport system substrate-binding protein
MAPISSLAAALLLAVIGASSAWAADPLTLRIGHFPNITHVQGLVANGLSRQGKGWFEPRLGDGVKLEWFIYNAGPSAMEAIFANSIDLTYVGPSPAINAYARSNGTEIRIISGAVEGGSALVVQSDSPFHTAGDFRGKRIATPQLGNTQDIAARAWLREGGLKVAITGGDVTILPTQNPDQLSLFTRKQLDAIWTVEPWVSRLELEAGGKILVEETDAVTTVVVSSVKFLEAHPDVVQRFRAAEAELDRWIIEHPQEAQDLIRAELSAETHTEVKPALIAHAWPRIRPTTAISRDALQRFVDRAKEAGLLKSVPDLATLVAD